MAENLQKLLKFEPRKTTIINIEIVKIIKFIKMPFFECNYSLKFLHIIPYINLKAGFSTILISAKITDPKNIKLSVYIEY
jgi:hypothetical protein